MPDSRKDQRDSKAVAASKAWLDEAIRSGRVVDETEQALREGLGAFLIPGVPRQADQKRGRGTRRLGRRADRARRSRP